MIAPLFINRKYHTSRRSETRRLSPGQRLDLPRSVHDPFAICNAPAARSDNSIASVASKYWVVQFHNVMFVLIMPCQHVKHADKFGTSGDEVARILSTAQLFLKAHASLLKIWCRRYLPSGLLQLGLNLSTASSAEAKNDRSYTSTVPVRPLGEHTTFLS